MEHLDGRLRLKLLIVGDGGVGKTCFCQRFFQQSVYSEADPSFYNPTIGSDFYTETYQVKADT